ERALTARQQRQPLDLLTGGLHVHLDARRQQVVGVGEADASAATRKQHRKQIIERGAGIFERRREDVFHAVVELVNDREQVFARVGEVGELVGEELVPLLERRELLQRERVHPAQLRELALEPREARLLLCPHERDATAKCRRLRRLFGHVPRVLGKRIRRLLHFAVHGGRDLLDIGREG